MSEEIKLKLPEPLKVDKNIVRELDELEKKGETIWTFAGEENIETMFELFLIKKYKSKCVILGKHNNRNSRTVGITISVKMKYTKAEEEEMKEGFKHISKKLVECVKKGENTIIIPLSYTRGRGGHANVLIYRKNLAQMEHFEPHGGAYIGNEKLQNSISKVMTMFTNILNSDFKKNNIPEIRYVEASNVCPYIKGLQTLEGRSTMKKTKGEPAGYCSAWSMFFSELCFKNPEIPSSEIMNNIYNYLTTKPEAENYLKRVIRGYTGYIVQTVNKYLEIFFKPKLQVVDVINFSKSFQISKINKLRDALKVLVMLESIALLDQNFNLEKELKAAKKIYKEKTKGMTEEEARKARVNDKLLAFLYYKKRILQNYEEYNKYGKITEPILDSPLEIKQEDMVNKDVIKKGRPEEIKEEFELIQEENREKKKTSPKSLKVKKTSPNAKTKRRK